MRTAGVRVERRCYPVILCTHSAREELQTVLGGDGLGLLRSSSCRASGVEHGHFRNHCIEDAARRTDDDLTAHLGTGADKSMWSTSRNEDHITRAELQDLFAQTKVIASLADDERLVVRGMTVIARAGLGGFDSLADGIGIPAGSRG